LPRCATDSDSFQLADDSLDDAPGFLCDVLLVSHRAAANFRAGRPARRPKGYGWLYAAPAVGALLGSATMLPINPPIDAPGQDVDLGGVASYGLATVVLGSRTGTWLTFLCLAWSGASDAVSMVIRNLVRQLETPDAMRGRMVGINMVFFMGGPQLGELEGRRGSRSGWRGRVGGYRRDCCLIATAVVVAVTAAAAALPVRVYDRKMK